MPPLQRRASFNRKDIAKAFFDLDISDSKPPTERKIPKPHNSQIASKPPLDAAKRNNTVGFLDLPLEIRLRIYDLLVVLLHMNFRQERTMDPRILQTCKQIYNEANLILYAQNVFAISEPEEMFRLIVQIGLVNLKLVRTLDIWVPWMAELSSWVQLLYTLAEATSGLRYIKLGWGAESEFPWQFRLGARRRGLGDDLDFVRALGKIQGLEKLVISGYYAKHWPAYLERTVVRLRAIHGHCLEESELKEEDMDDEELENEMFIRQTNERELQSFMKYQQGTEDLIP